MLQKFTFKQQSRKALLLFISLILVGCGQIGPYVEPESQDIPSGPGLFSGESGGFTFKSKAENTDTSDQPQNQTPQQKKVINPN